MSTLRYVTTHHSFATGWGFAVVEAEVSGGTVNNGRTLVAGNCHETRDKALEAGRKAQATFEEDERLVADLQLSNTKHERADQAALEHQVHMLRCTGGL